jgi:segregation and condensation protein A
MGGEATDGPPEGTGTIVLARGVRPVAEGATSLATMGYEVTTPVFEGPFDLLLHLILAQQVDVHEVALARIVDEFVAEIARMDHLDLDVTTEFLLIAATLVELKARRLLPGREDIDLDEELALWEERDLLLARLVECKTFKDVARVFADYTASADASWPRLAGPEEPFASLAPDLLEGTTPAALASAFARAVAPKPVPHVDLFHVAPVRVCGPHHVSAPHDRPG